MSTGLPTLPMQRSHHAFMANRQGRLGVTSLREAERIVQETLGAKCYRKREKHYFTYCYVWTDRCCIVACWLPKAGIVRFYESVFPMPVLTASFTSTPIAMSRSA